MSYDTVEGIETYLTDLEGLNRLSRDRLEAGYTRRERLNEFVVLGRYMMDTCGNTSRITDPMEPPPGMPRVVTREVYFETVPRMTSTMSVAVPPARVLCGVCQKGWTIDDCHDMVLLTDSESPLLTDFVGRTITELNAVLSTHTDAERWMPTDLRIKHERFINLAPHPKWPDTVINKDGWVRKSDGIDDDYVIQAGDEGYLAIRRYLHKACNAKRQEEHYLAQYNTIFSEAGVQVMDLKTIPNGYCPCEHCGPWVEVQTQIGKITMGWRKRVINIKWEAQVPGAIFKSEDVTFGDRNVHAWGQEKAIDYLKRLLAAAQR